MILKRIPMFAAAAVMALGAVAPDAMAYKPRPAAKASARMYDCVSGRLLGVANLREQPSDEGIKDVGVSMFAWGLTPGSHAVHIHEFGACEPCGAAGGHFDPGPVGLSNPDGNHPFHSGDLVNLDVNKHGVGWLHTRTTRVTLSPGPLSVLDDDGSAFIIHVNPDTYCPDGVEPGCAGGARAACGVIQSN